MNQKKEAISQDKAATQIQSLFKGYLSRKKYKISHLSNQELMFYPVLVQGNDPLMKGLKKHKSDDKIAIIGTSGMRSVEIACHLSEGIPKVIIVDNSFQVTSFWREARRIMVNATNAGYFLSHFAYYIRTSRCSDLNSFEEDVSYLVQLFSKNGFNKIKQIIAHATIIGQSWSDKEILVKLKNILAHHEIRVIYAYPSNIVAYEHAYFSSKKAQEVLDNIKALDPFLAIHTDLVNDRPEQVHYIQEHESESVKKKLGLKTNAFYGEVPGECLLFFQKLSENKEQAGFAPLFLTALNSIP